MCVTSLCSGSGSGIDNKIEQAMVCVILLAFFYFLSYVELQCL